VTDLIRRVHQIPGSLHRPDDPVVALTFDDGPGPSTPAVLDTLAETRTPAIFFMVGMQIESRPGDAVRAAAAGHTIGTHTWSHRRPDEIAGAVLDGLHPGAIVVMHDGGGRERPATVAALATIVTGARDLGYRFVAL